MMRSDAAIEIREIVWHRSQQGLKRGAIVALGTFDGVHRGHQAILAQACELAAAAQRPATALTFDRHPRSLLGGRPPLLTTLEEKLELLRQAGLAGVWLVHFDATFQHLTPARFVQRVLAEQLQISGVVAGFDFRYGRDGQGDATGLQKDAQQRGWQVRIVPPVRVDGEVVSSSGIRAALQQGDLARAVRWLGRPYRLTGQVVPGDGRGRTLGFPTANLAISPEKALPAEGVYLVAVHQVPDRPALLSISRKPTFRTATGQLPPLAVEVYVDGYAGDLYGQQLAVDCLRYLRPILEFPDSAALVMQMQQDREQARQIWLHLQG